MQELVSKDIDGREIKMSFELRTRLRGVSTGASNILTSSKH